MTSKEKILNETEELCSRIMPHNITLDMIAEGACVGKGTIYTHFKGKDDLFQQLALSLVSRLQAELVAVGFASSGNYMDKILAVGEAFNGFIKKHPMVIAITIFLKESPPWLDISSNQGLFFVESIFINMIKNLVKQGVDQGHLRSDIDEENLTVFITAALKPSSLLPGKNTLPLNTIRELILQGVSAE